MCKEIKFTTTKKDTPLLGYSSHSSFYASVKWRNLRRYKLEINPICEKCIHTGLIVKAEEVDHIVPIVDDESLALEITNLQSLCKSCHSSKTATDKNNRPKGTIINKQYNI